MKDINSFSKLKNKINIYLIDIYEKFWKMINLIIIIIFFYLIIIMYYNFRNLYIY